MLDFLQNLPLAGLFAFSIAGWLVAAWLTFYVVRIAVRWAGFAPDEALPIKDAIMSAANTIFALTMAFTAAGIWNDTLQARSSVQRETHALQNIIALADGLPGELGTRVRDGAIDYARRVVEIDWPAMSRQAPVDDRAYRQTDPILIRLIDFVSTHQSQVNSPLILPLLSQLFEARSAELARITLASTGVSAAQWFALILLAVTALAATGLVHYHHWGTQAVTMTLYAAAVGIAFSVILAHDRPFVGELSISPQPLIELSRLAAQR